MLPAIALVGRPNVGKSTLFNRLTRSRDALVANFSGLTRDRQYGEGNNGDRRFVVIDTGGVSGREEGIDAAMVAQSLLAVDEADAVLLLVDARAGLTAADEHLVALLRQREKPFHLVVNKIDGSDPDLASSEFHALGVSPMHAIAASQGRGVRQLMESVLDGLPPVTPADELDEERLRIAVVGRPNVGKSTLVNRILGEDRVVVYDQPGTTRDSVYIDFEREAAPYTLIDTAGVRRRKNVRETVEKFSIVKTLKAIDDAHVVLLLIDAQEGLVEQDLHLLGHCIEAGRALVLAVNKWDGLEAERRQWIRRELERRLHFVDYADTHFISALHGSGVGKLFDSIDAAYEAATRPMGTNRPDPHSRRCGERASSAHGQRAANQAALRPRRRAQSAARGSARQSMRSGSRQLPPLSAERVRPGTGAGGDAPACGAAQWGQSLCGSTQQADATPD